MGQWVVSVAFLCLFVGWLSPSTVWGQTPTPGKACATYTNTSCKMCLKNVTCLWCNTNQQCVDYPVRSILPSKSLCALSAARWGVCWVNFEALIIAMSVVCGIILIAFLYCCWRCCCRTKKRRGPDKEEEKAAREQEERRVRQDERRVEMKARHDEIRKKYGLFKEDNPYSKFDNN